MKNLKLSVKVVGGFLVLAAVVVIVGIVGISQIKTISNADMEMYTDNIMTMQTISSIDIAFQQMRSLAIATTLDKLAGRNPQEKIDKIKEIDKKGLAEIDNYEKQIARKDKTLFNEFKPALLHYLSARDKVISLVMEGKSDEALTYMDREATPSGLKTSELLKNLYEAEVVQAKTKADSNTSGASHAIWFSAIIVIIGTLLAVALGIVLSIVIVRPINGVIAGLGEAPGRLRPHPDRLPPPASRWHRAPPSRQPLSRRPPRPPRRSLPSPARIPKIRARLPVSWKGPPGW